MSQEEIRENRGEFSTEIALYRQLRVQARLSPIMSAMKPEFLHLNVGWNAEPNAPEPHVEVQGFDIVLRFYVNPFQFKEFKEDEIGFLRFVNCARYRLGPTNDEGWYRGQCRFSQIPLRVGSSLQMVTGTLRDAIV